MIQEIGNQFVTSLGDISVELVNSQKKQKKKIAQAFKLAATIDWTKLLSDNANNITANNQGFDCLKSLLPIEYEMYGYKYRYSIEDKDKTIRESRLNNDGTWETTHYLVGSASHLASSVILLLIEKYHHLKTDFAPFLCRQEFNFREKLYQASCLMTDEDWEDLASWIIYCFKN